MVIVAFTLDEVGDEHEECYGGEPVYNTAFNFCGIECLDEEIEEAEDDEE